MPGDRATSLALLTLALLLHAGSTCQPPDCDRQDCGTCGNACCTLKFIIYGSKTSEMYNLLQGSLKNGGADGRYRYVDGQDLRPFNLTSDYIIQGIHTTLVHHYNDTLNFSFSTDPDNVATEVYGFSISDIATAYCDEGQNYKNLVGFMKGLGVRYTEVNVAGCPPGPPPPF